MVAASVKNPDVGSTEDIIECEMEGFARGPLDIGFNSDYLAGLCATLAGDDQPRRRKPLANAPRLVIKLADPGSPTLLYNESDPRTLAVRRMGGMGFQPAGMGSLAGV